MHGIYMYIPYSEINGFRSGMVLGRNFDPQISHIEAMKRRPVSGS